MQIGVTHATESLHDADGFPRGDLSIEQALPLRKQYRMLQNDHHAVMLAIEKGLKSGMPLQETIFEGEPLGVIVTDCEELQDIQVCDIIMQFIHVSVPTVRIVRFGSIPIELFVEVQAFSLIEKNMRKFPTIPSHGNR